jgi:hypothetical protein
LEAFEVLLHHVGEDVSNRNEPQHDQHAHNRDEFVVKLFLCFFLCDYLQHQYLRDCLKEVSQVTNQTEEGDGRILTDWEAYLAAELEGQCHDAGATADHKVADLEEQLHFTQQAHNKQSKEYRCECITNAKYRSMYSMHTNLLVLQRPLHDVADSQVPNQSCHHSHQDCV